MFKSVGLIALLIFGGGYYAGAFGKTPYHRDVARPQAEVMRSLSVLDITAQPGAPGSDASMSGGIKPVFRLDTTKDSMTWFVMSGDKVATAMTAHFEPINDGKSTRVTTSVERGDAPDDFVSPAFRSKGLTTALFGLALEDRLNALTTPAAADRAVCQAIFERMSSGGPARSRSLTEAVGGTARSIMRLQTIDAELRRNGCSTTDIDSPSRTDGSEGGSGVGSGMDEGNVMIGGAAPEPQDPTHVVTFEPGKPMVDVSRK